MPRKMHTQHGEWAMGGAAAAAAARDSATSPLCPAHTTASDTRITPLPVSTMYSRVFAACSVYPAEVSAWREQRAACNPSGRQSRVESGRKTHGGRHMTSQTGGNE